MAEILASVDDINANLDNTAVQADDINTNLLQISVARVIRAYLSNYIDNAALFSWVTPDTTPDTIREIAAKLIASQLYFNTTAGQQKLIQPEHVSQRLYNEAIALLNQIISGSITIPGVIIIGSDSMSTSDFFPIDDTDRAFTMGQIF